MILADRQFASRVEATVCELEKASDAEIVVVAAPRSGHYRDVAWWTSLLLAFVALCFLLYSPFPFSEFLIPVDLLVVGGLGGWVVHRTPFLLRRLVPASRLHHQVETEARSAYIEEAIHGTKRHTGILVYLSELEQEVYILPDPVLDGHIPRSAWTPLHLHPRTLEDFIRVLNEIGAVLAAHAPAIEANNPDEIANAPRVRS